jgi:hypothetical protein
MSCRGICLVGAALLIAPGMAAAAPQGNNQHPAAVMQSNTTGSATSVPQAVKPPPLKLTDQDRQKIRDAVTKKNDQTTLSKKAAQAEKDFKPAVGVKVPAGLAKKGDALPQDLVRQLPVLKEYSYLVYNNQIMIVDPMSKKVVDLFPAS